MNELKSRDYLPWIWLICVLLIIGSMILTFLVSPWFSLIAIMSANVAGHCERERRWRKFQLHQTIYKLQTELLEIKRLATEVQAMRDEMFKEIKK